MGTITDLNIIGRDRGKHAALLGDAHELIVAGILIRLGFEVGIISAKGGPYDLWVIAFKDPQSKEIRPLRVQVKTISKGKSIKFIAGVRAGKDRTYKSDVKTYKYTTEHNDLIIGVDVNTLDLYLLPTRFIGKWGKSKATSSLELLKNNWDILLNWNDDFLNALEQELEKNC
ncbi:MAG: hypothetical protein ABC588_07155 [Candidatus Methanosuratincola petrocarbonis]